MPPHSTAFRLDLTHLPRNPFVGFQRKLIPLMQILSFTYDAKKFKTGVDFAGASRPEQARAQERLEDIAGLTKFDPDRVQAVLRDGMTFAYCKLCLMIEELPPRLAAFGEQCPCHSAFFGSIRGEWQKARLMQHHYGKGQKTCHAAGMMGPELVAGALAETAARAWENLEYELLTLETMSRATSMTEDQRTLLLDDCRRGQTILSEIIELKRRFGSGFHGCWSALRMRTSSLQKPQRRRLLRNLPSNLCAKHITISLGNGATQNRFSERD